MGEVVPRRLTGRGRRGPHQTSPLELLEARHDLVVAAPARRADGLGGERLAGDGGGGEQLTGRFARPGDAVAHQLADAAGHRVGLVACRDPLRDEHGQPLGVAMQPAGQLVVPAVCHRPHQADDVVG